MASYTGRGVHGQIVHALGTRIVGGDLPKAPRSTFARSVRNWTSA